MVMVSLPWEYAMVTGKTGSSLFWTCLNEYFLLQFDKLRVKRSKKFLSGKLQQLFPNFMNMLTGFTIIINKAFTFFRESLQFVSFFKLHLRPMKSILVIKDKTI